MSAPPAVTSAAPITYRVECADLHAHLFRVTLTVAAPQAQQQFWLPAWIPGSYLVREFAKNLQRLSAHQNGTPIGLQALSKDQWQTDCRVGVPLELCYEVCVSDPSVRCAWLDSQRGFFNATSVCLAVAGQENHPCEIEIIAPQLGATHAHWDCATALFPLNIDSAGFGRYSAANYDSLADCPVEMGAFWSAEFDACGVPHRFVVAGAAQSFDGARLIADTRRICEAAIGLWHTEGLPPFGRYLFLLNAVDNGYGGLEHQNSTALICKRSDLPRLGDTSTSANASTSEGYTQLLGLISHEYFHAWCVKRLRPAEFAPYDYRRENYTALLWFFEGFTSYYDDLLLRRAGLITDGQYLALLTKTIQQLLQTPGRAVQSVAEASFDAWVKYYRPDENTPNLTVSYYTKGALIALCLDLALRREGKTTLDAVMRNLWQRCSGGPMTEDDLLAALAQCTGRSWQAEIDAWVHSCAELPLADSLTAQGIAWHCEAAQPAQRLGLRVQEGQSVQIKTVLRGGLAEVAGMMAGDEWLAITVGDQSWRLSSLDDLALYAGQADSITAWVARDKRLLSLPLALRRDDAICDSLRLSIADSALVQQWLGPQ